MQQLEALVKKLKIGIVSQMVIEVENNKPKLTGKGILEALQMSNIAKKMVFVGFDKTGKFRRITLNKGKFVIYLLPSRLNTSETTKSFFLKALKASIGYVKNIILLTKIFEKEKLDAVKVENILLVGFPVYVASKLTKTPFFLWVAGPELEVIKIHFSGKKLLSDIISLGFKFLAFLVVRKAKVVINISPESEKIFLSLKPKIYVPLKANYVDINLFRPLPCTLPDKKKDKKVLLYVGRLEKEKGIELMLDAVEYLSEKRNDFELWIVGYGSMQEFIEEKAKKLNVEIKLLGKKDIRELPLFYNCADVVLLPSLVDGPSAALLEAMACGKAAVTTTGPIRDKISGILAERERISFANGIQLLLDNDKLRREIGNNAQNFIAKMCLSYFDTIYRTYLTTAKR
ncbi:MAG: glycosyltransferase family 4 protein [Candidatus Odinarchaeota archaeon]|nr:glycosyltransferase family 4 protein [Candidatus Odinarchaeota archaeon]